MLNPVTVALEQISLVLLGHASEAQTVNVLPRSARNPCRVGGVPLGALVPKLNLDISNHLIAEFSIVPQQISRNQHPQV